MSEENVDLIRRGHQAFRDSGEEAIFEYLDADIDLTPVEELLDSETFHGHDGVRRYFQTMRDAFGDFGWEPQEFLDHGDHVVVATRFFAAGRGSGIPVEAMVYNVWTVRQGKAVRAADRRRGVDLVAAKPWIAEVHVQRGGEHLGLQHRIHRRSRRVRGLDDVAHIRRHITGGLPPRGTCYSGTWLRQYAPFQDLGSSASCAQVHHHREDGTIDLTAICKMIDGSGGTATCSGIYQNASSAFGGYASRTVSQMLSYAASRSNVGGSSWYGNVKATQELAKNAFDAINNQVAFGP